MNINSQTVLINPAARAHNHFVSFTEYISSMLYALYFWMEAHFWPDDMSLCDISKYGTVVQRINIILCLYQCSDLQPYLGADPDLLEE